MLSLTMIQGCELCMSSKEEGRDVVGYEEYYSVAPVEKARYFSDE